jgi:NADH:ubiquinone reductase (H+-translocating)
MRAFCFPPPKTCYNPAMSINSQPHVVIVGGGFGGLYAAKALKSANLQVTLVDRRNHHLFQPLLYQVATAGLSPGDIAYPIRAVLRKQENARVLLAEAVSIDTNAKTLHLKDDLLNYDFLILAAGAHHSYFGHNEWEGNAPGLKNLEDALEIRRRILLAFERAERERDETKRRAWLSFVIVGGGPTGVEFAGAIAEIARHVMVSDFRAIDPKEARIVLLEAGPRLLAAFPEELSASAERALAAMGVEVHSHCPVTEVDSAWVEFGNERHPARTVLWAAGVSASPLAKSLGVALDSVGRVLVEPDLTIPGHPEVFVIGDLAAYMHQTGKPLPGVCPVAIQQGRHAAKSIVRGCSGLSHQPFYYWDKGNLATIGRAQAVADLGRFHISGFVAWVAWLFVHIFFLIGFRNRFIVLFEWAWAYFTFQRGARLITGDIDKYLPSAPSS